MNYFNKSYVFDIYAYTFCADRSLVPVLYFNVHTTVKYDFYFKKEIEWMKSHMYKYDFKAVTVKPSKRIFLEIYFSIKYYINIL